MQLRALKHLAGSIKALSGSEKVFVLGSSSLLACFPELGQENGPLTTTFDANFLLDPISNQIAGVLSEAVGENSLFYAANGYHADILPPDITKTLPPGWEERLVALEGFPDVFCLDPYDLAAVKIVGGREKDIVLVRHLLEQGKITEEKLQKRFQTMPLEVREAFKASRHFAAVLGNDS